MMKLSLFPTEKERFRQVPNHSHGSVTPVMSSFGKLWLAVLNIFVQHVDVDWRKTLVLIQRLFVCWFVSGLTSQKTSNCLIRKPFCKGPPENRHLSPYLDLVEKLTPIKKTRKCRKSWVWDTSCFSFWPGAVLTEFSGKLVTRHTDSDWINGWPFAVWKAFPLVLESFMENFEKLPWFERKYDFQAQIFSKATAKKDGLRICYTGLHLF